MAERDVIIIGGGVIGICTAYYLARTGCRVVVLEKSDIGSACSYGNAGLITPSHSIPIPGPGVIRRALKYMLQEDSPLLIRPRLDWQLFSWMIQFAGRCRKSSMNAAIPVLRDLSRASLELFGELVATERLMFDYEQRGLMGVYTSFAGLEAGLSEAELLRTHGFQPMVLDRKEARALEPALLESVVGAIFFREDAHGDSFRFVCQMSEAAQRLGVECFTHTHATGVEVDRAAAVTVHTNRGHFKGTSVVIATGSWAPELAGKLGIRIPLQPAKGYSVTMDRPSVCPKIPLLNMERKVAITPIGNRLRFAGTLEFAGFDLSPNEARTEAVLRGGIGIIPEIRNPKNVESWSGLRPCTPDGLPIIDKIPGYPNIYISTGHAMLGYTLGPISGKYLAEMITKARPLDVGSALQVTRFYL